MEDLVSRSNVMVLKALSTFPLRLLYLMLSNAGASSTSNSLSDTLGVVELFFESYPQPNHSHLRRVKLVHFTPSLIVMLPRPRRVINYVMD